MTARDETISIRMGGSAIAGQLTVPADALATVVFAHGSGSSRHSPRNRYVASVLQDHRLATLLFDLLTPEEEAVDLYTREYRFDIPFLAERLVLVTRWLLDSDTSGLPLGYFGASTGAAAALVAAAELPDRIAAVVSRGGRPDLAEAALAQVRAPTLLLVGGLDSTVLTLNRRALEQLRCEKELTIVPGATHLFEEPGTLEAVAELAAQWFVRYARLDDSNAADP